MLNIYVHSKINPHLKIYPRNGKYPCNVIVSPLERAVAGQSSCTMGVSRWASAFEHLSKCCFLTRSRISKLVMCGDAYAHISSHIDSHAIRDMDGELDKGQEVKLKLCPC